MFDWLPRPPFSDVGKAFNGLFQSSISNFQWSDYSRVVSCATNWHRLASTIAKPLIISVMRIRALKRRESVCVCFVSSRLVTRTAHLSPDDKNSSFPCADHCEEETFNLTLLATTYCAPLNWNSVICEIYEVSRAKLLPLDIFFFFLIKLFYTRRVSFHIPHFI